MLTQQLYHGPLIYLYTFIAHSKENQIELVSTKPKTNKNELKGIVVEFLNLLIEQLTIRLEPNLFFKATERNNNGFMSSIDSSTTAKPSGKLYVCFKSIIIRFLNFN